MKALRNRSVKEAEHLLATAIATLAPSPFPREELSLATPVEEIIDEACKRIQVKPPLRDVDKGRLLDLLSKELQKRMLTPERERAARIRLGTRGILRPSDFGVSFANDARKQLDRVSITTDDVARVVRNPLAFEHVLPLETDESRSPSIFLGETGAAHKNKLLVLSVREGDRQHVWSAWRIEERDFHSVLHNPRELVRAFAEKFGIDFVIGDLGPWRLLVRDTVVIPRNIFPFDRMSVLNLFRPAEPSGAYLQEHLLARVSPLGLIEVMFALYVNVTKYQEYYRDNK